MLSKGFAICCLAALAALCAGCPDPPQPLELVSGTYTQDPSELKEPRAWETEHPHANSLEKQVTVDRQAQKVQFEYVRDGHRIKEAWRIVRVELR